MTARPAVAVRTLRVSVREARLAVDRILLVCGLPSGFVHGVRETILVSQSLGLGGFAALLAGHAGLRPGALGDVRARDLADGALEVGAAGLHAWLLAPTLTDLAVDLARRGERGVVKVAQVAEPAELRTIAGLARRHGARAQVTLPEGSGAADDVLITMTNAPRPRGPAQWDPLLREALLHGYPVEETLWRAVYERSNGALAPDSVVSRRHAGPVIMLDDGTVVGRPPADDDFDVSMLRSVGPRPNG